MNLNLKSLMQKQIYKLNIQTKLSDDWIIQSLNSNPYFESVKLNVKIIISNKDILTIIGKLLNTKNGINMLIINGNYGFINDIFYEEKEYENIKNIIDERLNTLNIKKKDLIVGNLYERPDGSRFIFLGIKYLVTNKENVEYKKYTLKRYFSDLKIKYYLLNLDNMYINELDNKNLVIFKDLGHNGICNNIELDNYLLTELNNNSNIFRIYNEKTISSIKIQLKEEPYNKETIEELKKNNELIIFADGEFYKFLQYKKYNTQQKISGRPLSNVYYKYDLYQKINIIDNQIIMLPNLKHDFLETNSWYSNSSYIFNDSFELKNKTICANSDTFKNIDKNKIFTIEYIEI